MIDDLKKITYRQERKSTLVKIMGGKCCLCGYNKYIGALEFHHINPNEKEFNICTGNNRALEKELIEIKKCILLCSNCHREVHAGLYDNIEFTTSYNDEIAQKELNKVKEKQRKHYYYCNECGKQLATKSSLCAKCSSNKTRKCVHPSKEELKKMIYELPFTEIGRMYGVSGKAVEKWCIKYNLPCKKRIIKTIPLCEWDKI